MTGWKNALEASRYEKPHDEAKAEIREITSLACQQASSIQNLGAEWADAVEAWEDAVQALEALQE